MGGVSQNALRVALSNRVKGSPVSIISAISMGATGIAQKLMLLPRCLILNADMLE